MQQPHLLNGLQVAAILGVSVRTLWRLVSEGKFPRQDVFGSEPVSNKKKKWNRKTAIQAAQAIGIDIQE
jgi:hypothetical protein